MNKNRVWRRTNTYGIYLLAAVIASVVIYNLMELSRVCSAL